MLYNALSYADSSFEQFVEGLIEFLRIPSISTDPDFAQNVHEAAAWLAGDLRRAGIPRVEVMATGGHPIVYAELISDPSKPAVLIYGHYDVQPPDPLELWQSPPFEPEIRGGSVFARGASDDKGQLFMHVKAVEAYMKTSGELPINVKFLIEGEEESGSKHLLPFIQQHRDLLSADIVLISDTALFAEDVPSITYGLRGLAYTEIVLTGPNRDLHSGVFGGAIENPANVLARLIADLHDANHRITIPGFYDDVVDLTADERLHFRKLPFDEERWKQSIGVDAARTEKGYTILESISARPTLDVNGMWGGYLGTGAKTVLPSRAGAKISMRLVPDQKPEDITEKLKAYLEARTPPTVSLEFRDLHGGSGLVVDRTQPAMNAAFKAMAVVFGKEPVFTREGGSIPVVAELKKTLGMDTLLLGFGLADDAIHSPNEKFGLDRFRKGIETSIRFMEAYALDR